MYAFLITFYSLVLLADSRPQFIHGRSNAFKTSSGWLRRYHDQLDDSSLYSRQVFQESPLRNNDDISYVFEGSFLQDGQPVALVNQPEFSMKVRGPSNEAGKDKPMNDGPQETRILFGQRNKGPSPQEPQSDFVFPDDDDHKPSVAPRKPLYLPKEGSGCKKTFCEDTDAYPGERIERVLSNKSAASKFDDLLGLDELPVVIVQRIDQMNEFPVCESREEIVYPKSAQNKDDKWLFVVNHDKYLQGVRVEMCQSESEACQLSDVFGQLPLGYTTSCKQKYIYRKMLALDPSGEPYPDSFRLPSCCTCYFKKTGFGSSNMSPKRN